VAEQVERLAHHALRGEVWDKAFLYCREAGERALGRSANREAVAAFEQALLALTHLPERPDTLTAAIDVRIAIRSALLLLGEIGLLHKYLREAEALATALQDRRRLGRISIYMASYFWLTGDHEAAVDSARRGLAIATELEDFGHQVIARLNLGEAYHALGEFRRGAEILGQATASLPPALEGERFGLAVPPSVLLRSWLVLCLCELGEFAEAAAHADESARIAGTVNDPSSLAFAAWGIGGLHLIQGDPERAMPLLERSFALGRSARLPGLLVLTASFLGRAYTLSARVGEAVSLLEQTIELTTSMNILLARPLFLAWLGEAYLEAGRVEEAARCASRALDLAREHKERGQQARALRLRGEVASRRDPPDGATAEDAYRQALALADELGMRPLLAHCHRGLAGLYGCTGKIDQAHEHFVAAAAIFSELGMRETGLRNASPSETPRGPSE
jgi:tetratricopeptide (TPR) repeat protein